MKTPSISRQKIVETLVQALEPLSFVHAAWLGGSDGTGRTDQWSDIDLQAVVGDDKVEETLEVTKHAMESLSPIAHYYRLPKPTSHGHDQIFLSLLHADDCHLLDFVIMRKSSSNWFLEPARHGRPMVLFDKEGLVRPTAFDREAHGAKMAERFETLRTTFPLFQNFVKKAVLRGDLPDAVHSYFVCTIRPFVELARMRHCPDRYDYGLRYLDRDLPDSLSREIGELALPTSIGQIEEYRTRTEVLFNELLRAYDRRQWSIKSSPDDRDE